MPDKSFGPLGVNFGRRARQTYRLAQKGGFLGAAFHQMDLRAWNVRKRAGNHQAGKTSARA